MHRDLTPEEYEAWRLAYMQQPWGELRDDLRNMATVVLRSWRPKHEGEEPPKDLPDLLWPYWKTAAEKTESEVETYKRVKQQGIEAQKRMKEQRAKAKADGN